MGYIVTWSGLNVNLNTAQPPDVLHRLFWLAIIPNIVFSLLAFLLTLKFPVTGASQAEVCRHLDLRHQAHLETTPDNEVPDTEVEEWVQAK